MGIPSSRREQNHNICVARSVAESAFGGSPLKMTYVTMKAMPMGWINSIVLIQNFVRNMIHEICKIPSNIEANKLSKVVGGDAVVTCMDAFDYVPG